MYNCKEKQNTNNSGVPTGTIINFFGDTAPEGYLSCDGTEYLKSDYPELAAHLATLTTASLYVGSDNDHFKVPDLRGEFLRGTGTNSHSNQGSGSDVGVHQDSTMLNNLYYTDNNFQFQKYTNDGSLNEFIRNSEGGLSGRKGLINIGASYSSYTDSYLALLGIRPTNTSVLMCIKAI